MSRRNAVATAALRMPDIYETCDSGRLRRSSRRMLFHDFPILRRIRPILSGFHKLDIVAFAAELIELGYCDAVVARAAECSITTVSKLRNRMMVIGIHPQRVPLVRKPHWATFTTEHQHRKAASGSRGVYWDKQNKKWAVQRRIKGRTYRHGMFDCKEAAISKSLELWN